MAFGEITVNKLVEQTDKQLTEARELLKKAYILTDKLNKNNSSIDLQSILVYIGEAFGIVTDWQDYYSKFNNILTDKVEADSKEIIRLKSKVNDLLKEVERLREEQEIRVDKIVNSLNNTLNLIDENAKLIAGSKGNREKQKRAKGSESNRFIQELDTEKLIEVYKSNNYSIPKEVKEFYFRNYDITYNGLRERLIKAGVWKGRH